MSDLVENGSGEISQQAGKVWEKKRLGDVLTFQVGFPFSSHYFSHSGFGLRLIRTADLKSDQEVVFYNGPYSEAYLVRPGDLLVGMDADFIPCLWNKDVGLLNQRVGRVVGSEKLDTKFAYFYFEEPLKEVERATASTTVKHLSHRDVENIWLPLPSIEEQKAIGKALSDADGLIDTLDRLIAKKRAIKQAAMQQLLTGETRLPGFEGAWEEKSFDEVLKRLNAKKFQIQTTSYRSDGQFPVVDQGQELVIGYTDEKEKVFPSPEEGVIVFGDHTCIVTKPFKSRASSTTLLRHEANTRQ